MIQASREWDGRVSQRRVYGMILLVTALAPTQTFSADRETRRVTLDNGITVLLAQVPEADMIAIGAVYSVGFYHDPKGMTQASQLLERLICEGQTKSFKPGQALALVTRLGVANAEALPTVTHFDYAVWFRQLNQVLKIEAERLSGVTFTREIIQQEAPKCYAEVDFVEKVPKGGMVKHALMAIAQGWRGGVDTVSIHSGLESIPIRDLESFRRQHYKPHNLTLVIVGKFDESKIDGFLERHFGGIPKAATSKPSLVDWNSVQKSHTITWDGKAHAVCLSFPPPADPVDRAILSTWGALLTQKLSTYTELRTLSDAVVCTTPNWPVGPMPFFLYATARKASDIPEVRRLLVQAIRDATSSAPTALEATQLKTIAAYYGEPKIPEWDRILQLGKARKKTMRENEEQAITMVIADLATQWGIREANGMAPCARRMVSEAPDASRIDATLKRYLDESKQHITVLKSKE